VQGGRGAKEFTCKSCNASTLGGMKGEEGGQKSVPVDHAMHRPSPVPMPHE